MHLHFEKNSNTKCDCTILALSWMGKVKIRFYLPPKSKLSMQYNFNPILFQVPEDIPEVSIIFQNSYLNSH